jgi:hypothetical protein
VEATVLLCDYAEERLGKLYVMGGGWDTGLADAPLSIALAIVLHVPWDQTNDPHDLWVRLLTEDGEIVKIEGNPVQLEGKFEAGRPAGVQKGMSFGVALAPRFPLISLPQGSYAFVVLIDKKESARVPFRMIARPA